MCVKYAWGSMKIQHYKYTARQMMCSGMQSNIFLKCTGNIK